MRPGSRSGSRSWRPWSAWGATVAPEVRKGEDTRVEKPWGYEVRWAVTDRYLGKILHINRGEALSLQYKSGLVAPSQVWGLGAGLLILAFPALLGYLRTDEGPPPVENFIPVAIGAVAIAGLSTFAMDWWKFDFLVAVFGLGFVV